MTGELLIHDTSQVQARVPNPQVREISRDVAGREPAQPVA
jgi:hypothetical protein